MKKILIFSPTRSNRLAYILSLLEGEYEISLCTNIDDAIKEFDLKFQDLVSLIIDNPSSIIEVTKLIEHVHNQNGYMLAVPILVLSDQLNNKKDELYLDDDVIGVIQEGESKHVVLHRIEKAARAINSVSFQEFSEMLKVLPSLIYLKDKEGKYVFCSQYLHHLDHYDDPNWSIRGKTDLDIRKDKDNALKAMESDKKVIESGVGTSYVICEKEDGLTEYLQLIKEPVKKENGEVKGIIAIINNVTEQEELRQELRKKSTTDALTGLFNRQYFEEIANANLNKDVFPVSIISADCDGLKRINDEFGHGAGDQYICMTASLLKSVLPNNSYIFRMGGDEFLALLPKTTYDEAKVYLNQLNAKMHDYCTDEFVLEVSCGLNTMEKTGASIDACIAQSDKEMYEVKRKRKNGKE